MTRASQPTTSSLPSLGFKQLDDLLAPLPAPGLFVVSGPMAGGKTAFLLHLFCETLLRHSLAISYFCYELSPQELLRRIALQRFGSVLAPDVEASAHWNDIRQRLDSGDCRVVYTPPSSWKAFLDELYASIALGHRIFVLDSLEHLTWLLAADRDERMQMLAVLRQFCSEHSAMLFFSTHAKRERRNSMFDVRDLDNYQAIAAFSDLLLFVERPELAEIVQYDDGTSTEGTVQITIRKSRRSPNDTLRFRWDRATQSIKDFHH